VTAAAEGAEVLFRALVVCSGEECPAEYEVVGAREEIEALCCDCGLGLQSLGWLEHAYEGEETSVRLILLPLGSSPE
jgi:hypothetical protein